ncbi:MAG: reverse transcriptase family protein [Thermoanaerobaculia bacterium]|nr:reverse transcriptase family protein [Thermoanaerobaculia bacterium]
MSDDTATGVLDLDEPPKDRKELWERIRTTSRDEVIAVEMMRLGFWDEPKKPSAPTRLIRRMGELQREMRELADVAAGVADHEAALRRIREKRMAEARRKRVETRERQERERRERAEAWRQRRQREILYLGAGVSAGLSQAGDDERRRGNDARLREHGLPILHSAGDVAAAMEIDLGELRFLSFHRRVSETSHYRRFEIPKKTGGRRLISAPMPRLKDAQRWLLVEVLGKVEVHRAAHGFLPGRSIVTNAEPHVGRDVVINLDLKDFFPSITYRRVKGVFRALGYCEEVSTIFGLLATEPDVDTLELDGRVLHVHRGERHLPQGSPASPAITNVLCRRFDHHLSGTASVHGFAYSRYADDLTFSGSGEAAAKVGNLLRDVRRVIDFHDLRIHEGKTRVMRKGRRQEVTGLTVNRAIGVDRKSLRRLRAVLFQIEKDGPEGKIWNGVGGESGGDVFSSLLGYANFVRMVDRAKGGVLVERIQSLRRKYDHQMPVTPRYPKKTPSWKLSPDGEGTVVDTKKEERRPWWMFWKR